MKMISIFCNNFLPAGKGEDMNNQIVRPDIFIKTIKSNYLKEEFCKRALRQRFKQFRVEIRKKPVEDSSVIEIFVQGKEDMVVINLPYRRHESIKPTKKNYYSTNYNIDKKYDIYAHFLIRPLALIPDNVVVSVILSDKYLETSFVISVKNKLKCIVVALYSQEEWIFNANLLARRDVLKRGDVLRLTYLN